MIERPKVTKVDAVVSQLEAATYLMLKSFRPEPVHTLIWASRSILWDLHKVKPIPILEKLSESIDLRVKPEFKQEWKRYEVRAANFLKHADRDPNDVLEGVDIAGINLVELAICILSVRQYLDRLSMKLVIGLAHVGFISGDWFDFRGIFVETTGRPQDYDNYSKMCLKDRQDLMLSAFELLHDQGNKQA